MINHARENKHETRKVQPESHKRDSPHDRGPLVLEDQSTVVSQQKAERMCAYLFRKVKIRFSNPGFDELRSLLKSDVRHDLVSFPYVVP
jgi:hypothetical protein